MQHIEALKRADAANDLPCVLLYCSDRSTALDQARAIVVALGGEGAELRLARHVLPAVDPGKHSTSFQYERSVHSIVVDLTSSEIARTHAVDWLSPIVCHPNVVGRRRCVVLHGADRLSCQNMNALKKIIEVSYAFSLLILTTDRALPDAIASRAVVVRCKPGSRSAAATEASVRDGAAVAAIVGKALAHAASPISYWKASRDCAQAISQMSLEASASVSQRLHLVLAALIAHPTTTTDEERRFVVEDVAAVSVHVAGASSASSTLVSLSTALSDAFVRINFRRRFKAKPSRT